MRLTDNSLWWYYHFFLYLLAYLPINPSLISTVARALLKKIHSKKIKNSNEFVITGDT